MLIEFNSFNTFIEFLRSQNNIGIKGSRYTANNPFIYSIHKKNDPEIIIEPNNQRAFIRSFKYTVKIISYSPNGGFYFSNTYRGTSPVLKEISKFLKEINAKEFIIIKSNLDNALKISQPKPM